MKLEEIYMENVIDYYKKDCYEKKKLFFELVEYQKKSFLKKTLKYNCLQVIFIRLQNIYFLMNVENDIYNIVNEGKDIIRNLYNSNQEKFEVYIFYICILQGKRKNG